MTHLRSGGSAEAQLALLQLQRQYGNRHVQRILKIARQTEEEEEELQAQRENRDEEEVTPLRLQRERHNRAVQRVPKMTRQTEEEEELQAQREDRDEEEVAPEVEAAINRKRGGGQALESGVRAQMGAAFGADFSGVRVHADSEADTLNRALGARAFTTGRDVFFRQGEYTPATTSGQELLAHELTHVVQQGADRSTGAWRLCAECEESLLRDGLSRMRPKLVLGQQDDAHEREADEVARIVVRGGHSHTAQRLTEEALPIEGARASARGLISRDPTPALRRVPAPGRDFGTYRYCGFGLTTGIPGFVKSHIQDNYDVDYTSGCSWIWWNAWSSVWELYDAQDRRLDQNTESPLGEYAIPAEKVREGTPGDSTALWSLWYRVTRSQPWLTDDNDAYPYDYKTFPVYDLPIKETDTQLLTEVGQPVWEDMFTPPEDDASLTLNYSTNESRTTTDSQTTSVEATIGGERSSNVGFEYEGLTAGFANSLSFSVTQAVSRTHSLSVETSKSFSKQYVMPNLRGGVTYRITARPLYHLIDGSVGLINHRDGVITGGENQVRGAIRILKGIDLRGQPVEDDSGATARGRWSCDAQCNVEGTGPDCTGRVRGHASGKSSQNEACREAKRDATQKAPRGCYARHCRCLNCTNR